MKRTVIIYVCIINILCVMSCGHEFLDIKERSNYVIPNKISDYQAILDSRSVMNYLAVGEFAYIGSDEIYLTETSWSTLPSATQKNGYIWSSDVYGGEYGRDWENGYRAILHANLALQVERIIPSPAEQDAWNNVKGSALFFRAYNHYALAQLFCKPYDSVAASKDLGLPLRLDADFTIRSQRTTLQATYDQILKDLEVAEPLLPIVAISVNRPSKIAVYALLARIYLTMGDYSKSLKYANMVLDIKRELLDFNQMNLSDIYLVPADWQLSNVELIFESTSANISVIAPTSRLNVNPELLELYDAHDLRKAAFYRIYQGRTIFKGGYNRGIAFSGLALNECYLILAESQARLGDSIGALRALNTLLMNRYDQEYFSPLEDLTGDKLIERIILERRKELAFRGMRWNDLRRLNKDPKYSQVLVRQFENTRYVLNPNDKRYTWPIPENEIDLSGIEQNER